MPSGHPVRLIAIAAGALVAFIVGMTWAVTGSSGRQPAPAGGAPRMAQPGRAGPASSPPAGGAVDASSLPRPSSSSSPIAPGPANRTASQVPPPKPPPASQPPRELTAALTSTRWPGALGGTYTIHDVGTAPVTGWTLVVTFGGTPTRLDAWGASASPVAQTVTFTAQSYNATVAAGGSVMFGFTAYGSGDLTPTACTVNGRPC